MSPPSHPRLHNAKLFLYRVNSTAPSPVPVKSNHKLQKSRNKRRRRNPRVVHINVCSTTDDSLLSQINDQVLNEGYVLLSSTLSTLFYWGCVGVCLGYVLMSRWILRRQLHRVAMDIRWRKWFIWNHRQFHLLRYFTVLDILLRNFFLL